MRKVLNHRVTRRIAGVLVAVCLLGWNAPSAAAFQKPRQRKPAKTQTPDAELRAKISAKEKAAAQQPDVKELSAAEMSGLRGRGANRQKGFSGVLPWQKSFRDVNLCNGNLFKSFTDIQVSPARGAGLAWQRTYNSNDERVGPFGIGWTHAYDIRIEEDGNNQVPRTDFFGGKHDYHRDADGLYSPPAYMFDELSSEYDDYLVNGAKVLSDDQYDLGGTVKHFEPGGTNSDSSPSSERVIDTMTDRHGNVTQFTYGGTATLPDGSTKKLLTEVTDPSGRELHVSWTNLGTTMSPAWRITQVEGPYDESEDPIYTVTYEYNNDFNLWKVHQDPAGLNRTTTYTYTTVSGEAGLLASVADGLGHTVSYTYAVDGETTNTVWVTSVTEPSSGGSLTWTIWTDLYGHAPGNVWESGAYSSWGGQSIGFAMCTDANLRCLELAIGTPDQPSYTWIMGYDSDNNLTLRNGLVRYPDGTGTPQIANPCEKFTYGPHGNVLTSYLDGISNSTATTTYYNASKYFQKASVEDPNGNVFTFDYFDNADTSVGNRGEVKWVRDARYGTTGEQFEYTYNSYGQKLTETNLNNVVTEYEYGDTWGNLTQVVQDPGTGTHLHRTTEMEYDGAGRVVASSDPKNQTSSFSFDGVGQPTEAALPDETISYTYGTNGRTESVTDGRGTTEINYESGNDRVASIEDPVTGTVSYTYGPQGQKLTISLPGGDTWTYGYREGWVTLPKDDPNSLAPMLEKVTDDDDREVQYWFDTRGGLLQARGDFSYNMSGDPVSFLATIYTRDAALYYRQRGVLTQIENRWATKDPMTGVWSSTLLVGNGYTYDYNGNRLTNTISDNSGPIRTEEYGYDALNQLTSVDYDDGTTQSYAFDPMGNRTSKTENSITESYTYNAANMLLSRGSNSYTNDANGNSLTGGGRTNTWDAENRLIECEVGTDDSTFVYGADGARRQATINSTTTDYILDDQSVVREKQGTNGFATYLHGPRGPEYRRNDSTGTVRWYLYDGLGSVLGEVDGTGNITASRKYDVYGALRASTGTSTSSHKFVGNLGHPSEDGTGLIYMRARYCDPVAGRFVSEDPARQGNNWYVYASDNPTNFVDADGREFTISGNLASMGIGAVFGAATYAGICLGTRTRITWQGLLFSAILGAAGGAFWQGVAGAAAAAGKQGLASMGVSSMSVWEFALGMAAGAIGGLIIGSGAGSAGKALKIVTGYRFQQELAFAMLDMDAA